MGELPSNLQQLNPGSVEQMMLEQQLQELQMRKEEEAMEAQQKEFGQMLEMLQQVIMVLHGHNYHSVMTADHQ